jgi:hypothetical protein
MGLNLNLIYFKSSSYGCITENLWKLNPEIGAVVTPIQEFSIGASFIPGFTGNPKTINNCVGGNTYVPYVKYPNRFKIGTEVRLLNKNLNLSLDYHYANTGSIAYLKDQSNYNIGLDYIIDENWIFRCGYFTMFDFEEKTYQSNYSDDLYFVTLGTTFKFKNYSFNLGGIGVMSGNLDGRDYFVINFGAGYEF